MVTGDSAYIKKINRSLILKNIIEHQRISRADLSKITGLNKATISVQIADLLKEELIYETRQEHNAIGRRPIMLSINGKAGYVLGIDLDYHEIKFTVCDLQGKSILSDKIKPDTDNYDDIVQLLIKQIKIYQQKYSDSRFGIVAAVIGIHGTVNKDQSILFIPKYQWHHKDLKTDLENEIKDLNFYLENNANLSSKAEKVFKYNYSDNLLTVILTSGIGAGIIIDGKLHRGYHGYAGEMGHMIIVPDGIPCKCGNHGCWERYASEPIFVNQLSEYYHSNLNYNDIRNLLDKQDRTTTELMKEYIKYISIGLNNIINLYNPETIVLNSELLKLYPNALEEIKSNLHSSVSQYREIVLSELGQQACILGACAFGIQSFLEVPEIILSMENNQQEIAEEVKL
ncbi:ROK family transcriptional regulator [Oceanobacillus halophilus]|uniref:ROK family transcriptional regulator n=1 Tax=Oceanobacillus halophilus TaxID=930130 RepID=A0A494ZZB8_9BACI|nr:ROK family transcriptional regulator [Oceanobacillus halophilus]RKQ32295.1 ROK family transcriptional regulator [Oceanobacillus halophilus]